MKKKAGYKYLLLIIVGLCLLLVPFVRLPISEMTNKLRVSEYSKAYRDDIERAKRISSLAKEYNGGLRDDASSVSDPFLSKDIKWVKPIEELDSDEIIGFVQIPNLGINLPIYLGSTDSHLSKGAALVDGTAIPLGEAGKNSVIAGNNGFYRQSMFFDLEKLSVGDPVYIYSLGSAMKYEVADTYSASPGDVKPFISEAGKEMVTLISPTPYPSNVYRHIVVCQRVESDAETGSVSGQMRIAKEKYPINRDIKIRNTAMWSIAIVGIVVIMALTMWLIRRIIVR